MRARRVVLLLVITTMFMPAEVSAAPVYLSFYVDSCSGSSIGRIPVTLDSGDKIQGSFNLTGSSQEIQQVSFAILTEGSLGQVYPVKRSTLLASNWFDFTLNPTAYSFPITSNRFLMDFEGSGSCSGSSPNIGVQLSYDIVRHFDLWLVLYGILAVAGVVGVVYLRWFRPRKAPQKKLENWTKN